jgi:hypothetical protein
LLSDHARAVVKAVEEQKMPLREAPYVVIDLRGNGGGSSVMGRQIAASLLGAAAADARLGPATETACGGPDGSWRASEDNIKQLEFVQASPLVTQGGPEIKKIVQDTLRDARAAFAQGKAFSASINCPIEPRKPPAATQPPALMKGRLILLTDTLCFSSCLSVTDDFRTLGNDRCRHSLRRCARCSSSANTTTKRSPRTPLRGAGEPQNSKTTCWFFSIRCSTLAHRRRSFLVFCCGPLALLSLFLLRRTRRTRAAWLPSCLARK